MDRDGDGLSDHLEAELELGDPAVADSHEDSDGDGLEDAAEVLLHGTNPAAGDSDQDGVPDGEELRRGADPLDHIPPFTLLFMSVPAQELRVVGVGTGALGQGFSRLGLEAFDGVTRVRKDGVAELVTSLKQPLRGVLHVAPGAAAGGCELPVKVSFVPPAGEAEAGRLGPTHLDLPLLMLVEPDGTGEGCPALTWPVRMQSARLVRIWDEGGRRVQRFLHESIPRHQLLTTKPGPGKPEPIRAEIEMKGGG